MFFPDTSARATEGLAGVGPDVTATAVAVVRPDGRRLEALDLSPHGIRPTAALLWLHGNAGNLAGRAARLGDVVRGTGVRILAIDYSGFGGSPGVPTEDEVVMDGLAAYDHLRAQGVPAAKIVVYGESLGGAVAAVVASERACAGAILQSTFVSLSEMAKSQFAWLPLLAVFARGHLDTEVRLRRLRVPVVVIHGVLDELVPVAHAHRLTAAAGAGGELVTIPGAHHNDVYDTAEARHTLMTLVSARVTTWTRSAEGDDDAAGATAP